MRYILLSSSNLTVYFSFNFGGFQKMHFLEATFWFRSMIRTTNVTPYGVQIATNLQSNMESMKCIQANDMSIDGISLRLESKLSFQESFFNCNDISHLSKSIWFLKSGNLKRKEPKWKIWRKKTENKKISIERFCENEDIASEIWTWFGENNKEQWVIHEWMNIKSMCNFNLHDRFPREWK